MAFDDLPIVDKSSKNSEDSERCVRNFLNQSTGFICRNEIPDKGCDLYVELILNSTNNSNWRFSIQIKSAEILVKIKEEAVISFSIETSRLGYLCRGIPAMGYIILYSVTEGKCYFEHVANIYNRLMEERENDNWKKNNEVNVHIPIQNALTIESAKEIHKYVSKVFENASLLQASAGNTYNLPTVSFNNKSEFDLRNPDNIVKFLTKYGFFLISSYDIKHLFDLISKVPTGEMLESSELLFIAAITYCEVGKNNEAKFYLNKCIKKADRYSEEQKKVIEFYKNKIRFSLGEINFQEYTNLLKEQEHFEKNEQNNITLKINVIFFELLSRKGLLEVPKSLSDSIQEIFQQIDNSDIDEKVKWLLRIWNCENYGFYVGILRQNGITEIKIRESLGETVDLNEKRDKILFELSAQDFINKKLQAAKIYGDSNDEELVSAYAMCGFVRNGLNKHIDYFSFSENESIFKGHASEFVNLINLSLSSSDIFFNNTYFKESYSCLTYAFELISIAKNGYNLELNLRFDESVILNNMKVLERELDYDKYNPVLAPMIEKKLNKLATNSSDMSFLKDLTDEQIETFARYALKGFNLPPERLINIINEMKAYRLFWNRCKDSNISVLQYHRNERAKENYYIEPVKFVLRSKTSGIETVASSDMEFLLKSWKI